ncbi:MAG: carboxylesterase family protein [Rudaea sp.]|uniref:carboxylesterase/lipase family protein n=1 Tax=Rudaea sp. TaxID=2136325 RepID=UPI0039E45099
MRTRLCGWVGFAVVWFAAAGAAWAKPAVTETGAIEGVSTDGVTVYKGVPFAAPPVGALRWRPPQRVAAWTGVRRADKFAPACMQKGVSMPGETPPSVSEDCLYLNLWKPGRISGERLPVLVWIHGGGYANGSASMPLYAGDRLARRGIIVVTVAYRLGPFGFLAHPELTAESPNRSSGNYGLMDQIAALRWIQRNIAAFGGDAARVTVAGQSAGAMSVSMLIASPLAHGLFARAIAESGGLFEPVQLAPNYLLANAEHDGEEYAASLGVKSIRELRELTPAVLLSGRAHAVTHPVAEPQVLPLGPYDAYVSARQGDVPVLLGANADEARSLTDVGGVTAKGFEADIEKTFGVLPSPLMTAYPHATDAQAKRARLDFERDLRFGWDMWTWARLQVAQGKSRVFYYSFDRRPPFPANSIQAGWGASHFAELWYVFDHLDQAGLQRSAPDRELADRIVGYWTNFIATGDPNGAGLPAWPAFDGERGQVLHLDSPVTVGGVESVDTLKVFDVVYASVRGKPFGK